MLVYLGKAHSGEKASSSDNSISQRSPELDGRCFSDVYLLNSSTGFPPPSLVFPRSNYVSPGFNALINNLSVRFHAFFSFLFFPFFFLKKNY